MLAAAMAWISAGSRMPSSTRYLKHPGRRCIHSCKLCSCLSRQPSCSVTKHEALWSWGFALILSMPLLSMGSTWQLHGNNSPSQMGVRGKLEAPQHKVTDQKYEWSSHSSTMRNRASVGSASDCIAPEVPAMHRIGCCAGML